MLRVVASASFIAEGPAVVDGSHRFERFAEARLPPAGQAVSTVIYRDHSSRSLQRRSMRLTLWQETVLHTGPIEHEIGS